MWEATEEQGDEAFDLFGIEVPALKELVARFLVSSLQEIQSSSSSDDTKLPSSNFVPKWNFCEDVKPVLQRFLSVEQQRQFFTPTEVTLWHELNPTSKRVQLRFNENDKTTTSGTLHGHHAVTYYYPCGAVQSTLCCENGRPLRESHWSPHGQLLFQRCFEGVREHQQRCWMNNTNKLDAIYIPTVASRLLDEMRTEEKRNRRQSTETQALPAASWLDLSHMPRAPLKGPPPPLQNPPCCPWEHQ
ncbi:hypothetical protein QOT17_006030 [Balamuthia mandrillaris]